MGAYGNASVIDELAEELARRWRAGERPLVEELFALHPWLRDQPEAAFELIAEELCLRQENGLDPAAANLPERFPQWQRQVRALGECHHVLAPATMGPSFPEPGAILGEFRLIFELGRGAQGRAYLATQEALADRPVVLKLAAADSREHLSLGRLQHSHIVPLYSIHDFPTHKLCGLCQPYFGGATLARLLQALRHRQVASRQGQDLLSALRQSAPPLPTANVSDSPACRFLADATYEHAVCWLVTCLADALQYAHERGLIHLDVKPSNVLIAADGLPMLLDFHLAHSPLPAGIPAPACLGGTPGYMAPELAEAMRAVSQREPIPRAVDGRADLYSLGLLLFEALAGCLPPTDVDPAIALRRANRTVTRGLAALIARCLSAEPAKRYAMAADVAADLRRHLADLPLRGVPERSYSERWGKWRRRRPRALPWIGLFLVALSMGGTVVAHVVRQLDRGRAALQEGEQALAGNRYAEAEGAFQHGMALVDDLPGSGHLVASLQVGAAAAKQGRAADELHRFCDSIRPLFGMERLPQSQCRDIRARCAEIWAQRQSILEHLTVNPLPEPARQVRIDLLDVALLRTDLCLRSPAGMSPTASQKEALTVLAEAEELLGSSPVLDQERARLRPVSANKVSAVPKAPESDAQTGNAWELSALGRNYLRAGDLAAASALLDRAVQLEPQSLWPNYYRGCCAFRQSQFHDAVIAFSICAALAPQLPWCFHNRGLANAELGRVDPAIWDFTHALELDPSHGDAALRRGILYGRQHRHKEALADLRLAEDLGEDAVAIQYHRALAHVDMNEQELACASLRIVLRLDSSHAHAKSLLERIERQK